MTHDELLAKVDTLEARYTDYPTYLALLAVVELHKMQEITLPDGSYGQNCIECDNSWGFCATLHAIIDELK